MMMPHGINTISPAVRGGGGMGVGGGVLVVQSDHTGLIPGHYGPASSSTSAAAAAADVIQDVGRMTEHPSLLDHCGSTASGSSGGGSESRGYRPALERGTSRFGGGERGYETVASERGYHPGLERCVSGSGERVHDFVAPPILSSMLLFSRSKSFCEDSVQQEGDVGAGSGAGGARHVSPKPRMVDERQRSWGMAAPLSPAKPHHQHLCHDHPPPVSQQPRPMPSPVASMKNERGYSFASPGASAMHLYIRGVSSPGSFSGGRDRPAVGGDEQQHRHCDIPPPPPFLSTPVRFGGGAQSLSSPGEILSEEGDRSSVAVFGGTRTTAAFPSPSFRSSPSPFYSSAKSLPVAASATASSRDDSLYADLALPSPCYTVRGGTTAAFAASQGELHKGGPLASPGVMTNKRGEHDNDDQSLHQPSLFGDFAPTKGSPLLRRSSSGAAAAAAMNEDIVDDKDKEAQLPSLTCASLGGADKVRKAEDIVAAMLKLADFNSCLSGDGVGVPLPSKIQITKAMAILEDKIKLKSKEAMCVRKEVNAIKAAEVNKEVFITALAKNEEKRIAKEVARLSNEGENMVNTRRLGREESVTTRRRELTDVYKSHSSTLQEKRDTNVASMAATCQSDIDSRVVVNNYHITMLRHQLQEVEKQISELDKAHLHRKTEFSSLPPGSVPPEITADDDATHNSTGIPTFDFPGNMSELVGHILAENQMIAKQAHLFVLECIPYFPHADGTTSLVEVSLTAQGDSAVDEGETSACTGHSKSTLISSKEWSNRVRKVTGFYDALYSEPTELPHFHDSNDHFIEIAPLIKECIRRKDQKLKSRWTALAEHYVIRQTIYNEQTANSPVSERGASALAAGFLHSRGGEYYDAMNNKESSTSSTPRGGGGSASQNDSGVRGSNPYRSRPRRGILPGDVVRSDYEQEQIIAEIAAKEAMEKRIKEGGCSLPHQRGWLENQLYASHSDGFLGMRVNDSLSEEEERRDINIWSDMEKCIFLDRFLHHPKDFRKIASFLKHKTTKECIKFYYSSKKTVPYKNALKEFIQRKNRRGDVMSWDATIQACISMGAVVKAGYSSEKPLKIFLPEHDLTYHTRNFHPMRLEVFQDVTEALLYAKQLDDSRAHANKNRKRSNWFILDAYEKKYLGQGDDDHHSSKKKSVTVAPVAEADISSDNDGRTRKKMKVERHDQCRNQKPQKWKMKEKELFLEGLEKYGHDWMAVSEAVRSRTPTQVKNYFYDSKKTIAKQKENKAKRTKVCAKAGKATAKHVDMTGGKKKTNDKMGKKEMDGKMPTKVATPKKFTQSTDETDSTQFCATATDSTKYSHSESELIRAGPEQIVQQAHGHDQEEKYRQHQFHVHQQQLQHQQLQLQQQQLERLVQQQRQEELYRQQMQQEEMYRHHLRQQEILQAAQHAQLQHQQQYGEPGQNWNQLDHRQLQNLQSMLALRHSDQTPPIPQNYPIHCQQQQGAGYGNTRGGGPQQPLHNSSDLGRVYQAAVAAGIPASALEAALASAGGGGVQHQQPQNFARNENQHKAMSMELLHRLTQQQNQKGDGSWYGDDPYRR